MPKLKTTHISPTSDEDTVINAGIDADPYAPDLDGLFLTPLGPSSSHRHIVRDVAPKAMATPDTLSANGALTA